MSSTSISWSGNHRHCRGCGPFSVKLLTYFAIHNINVQELYWYDQQKDIGPSPIVVINILLSLWNAFIIRSNEGWRASDCYHQNASGLPGILVDITPSVYYLPGWPGGLAFLSSYPCVWYDPYSVQPLLDKYLVLSVLRVLSTSAWTLGQDHLPWSDHCLQRIFGHVRNAMESNTFHFSIYMFGMHCI